MIRNAVVIYFRFFTIPLYSIMRIILLLLFTQAGMGKAQLFLNELGDILGETPYFNETFIAKKGIQSIRGNYWTKAELDYMYPSPDFVYYQFNRSGQLIYEKKAKYLDTTEMHYTYYNNSTLSRKLKRDQYGYHVRNYSYDSEGRLLRSSYHQHRTNRKLKKAYDQNKATLVSDETFSYQDLSEILYKKVYLNSSGAAYKEEFFHWNEKKELLRQESKLKTGTGITEVDYHYDKLGRVIEKTSMVKFISEKTVKQEYTYDEKGNLESIKTYKNDFYLTEYQFVYRADQTLKAIIRRNVPSNFITIIKFEAYTYFSKL